MRPNGKVEFQSSCHHPPDCAALSLGITRCDTAIFMARHDAQRARRLGTSFSKNTRLGAAHCALWASIDRVACMWRNRTSRGMHIGSMEKRGCVYSRIERVKAIVRVAESCPRWWPAQKDWQPCLMEWCSSVQQQQLRTRLACAFLLIRFNDRAELHSTWSNQAHDENGVVGVSSTHQFCKS